MDKRSLWKFDFKTASLVLIPTAVGINYIGKLFAGLLKLPLWLDSIGTILASILAGPIIGAIAGATNNIIYGLTLDPVSFIYGLTSIAIGIVVGMLAYRGFFNTFYKAILSGLIVGLVAAIVSTPINIGFWGGQTGNVWGDSLFAYLIAKDTPLWVASFLDEMVVDLPDKIATVVISYIIYKGLPGNIIDLFKQDDEIKDI